jgi:prepilin peptidase CpaA
MPTAVEAGRWLVVVVLSIVLTIAGISDIRVRRIPNWTILAIAALFLPWAVIGPGVSIASSLETALLAFFMSFSLYAVRLVGAGDSKLLTVAALYVGLHQFLPFLLLVAIAGGIVALVGLAMEPARALAMLQLRRGDAFGRDVPYGVAIGIATILVVAVPLILPAGG